MAEKTILVYIFRHGETQLNAADCFRGSNDVSLSAAGRRDAHQLAKYLEPIEISHMVVSDRRRVQETARVIAERKGIPFHTTPNLRAWDVGEFSGKKKTPETEQALQYYIENPDLDVPGGESLSAFKARVRPCYTEAVELADRCGEPVLLGASSSNIHELGSMFYDDHQATLVHPGGVAVIFVENGKLGAETIFKSRPSTPAQRRADTVS